MKRQPGVVEAKSHEWKQEIHLWVYVVVVILMFLESWWWSQYCFFFCLLLVILATVFSLSKTCLLTINNPHNMMMMKKTCLLIWGIVSLMSFWKSPLLSSPPFFVEMMYKQHEYHLDITLLLFCFFVQIALGFLPKKIWELFVDDIKWNLNSAVFQGCFSLRKVQIPCRQTGGRYNI